VKPTLHSTDAIVAALRGELRRDPDGLRTYVLDTLRELTGSSVGVWARLGVIDGEPLPTRWIVRGAPAAIVQRRVEERLPWLYGDPRAPDARWNRRFVPMRSVIDPRTQLRPTQLYRRCYEPDGLHDELSLVVYHRDCFVAWIAVVRGRGERPFERADLRRVSPLAGAISDALIAAEARERAQVPDEPSDLVVRADGTVELASEPARRLLALPRDADELRAWARRVGACGAAPELFAGQRVRWTRLEGIGEARYLLRLEPIAPLPLHPTYVLSQMQREIAALAAAGATAPEIAAMKAMALPTVRTHLRQVYERLNVTSRAELALAVAPAPQPLERSA
jgi:DNA-binding CsgD family transcriptional regulator